MTNLMEYTQENWGCPELNGEPRMCCFVTPQMEWHLHIDFPGRAIAKRVLSAKLGPRALEEHLTSSVLERKNCLGTSPTHGSNRN